MKQVILKLEYHNSLININNILYLYTYFPVTEGIGACARCALRKASLCLSAEWDAVAAAPPLV